MAITWDPASVTSVTLSGGNLVATNTGTTSADQGARVASANGLTAGKYYFEGTWTARPSGDGSNYSIGVGTTASTYTNMGNGGTTGVTNYIGGSIYSNGSNTGVSSGTIWSAGQVVGVAVDLDNRRAWFRNSPSGNWNNGGANNPATNVGGVTIPAGTMVPFVTFGGTGGAANNVFTANFAGPFVGTVPSGFLSLATTNALATQAFAEHWLTTNPNAQTTQIVLEHWGSVTSDNLQMLTTQVLLEHWASVANVSRGAPMVTMVM